MNQSAAEFWRRLTPFTRRLVLITLLNATLLNLILFLLPKQPRGEWTWRYTTRFFMFSAGYDSWQPMWQAAGHLQQHPDRLLYQSVFFEQNIKFQYPPSSLLALELIRLATTDRETAFFLLNVVNWASVVLTACVCGWIAQTSLATYAPDEAEDSSAPDRLTRIVCVFMMTFGFMPIVRSFELGQIQGVLTLLIAGSFFALMRGRSFLAGMCIGVACLTKPQLGLLLLWAATRREYRFVAAMLYVAATGAVLSVMTYGWNHHWDYLTALRHMAAYGEAYHPNQGIGGFITRALGVGDAMQFYHHQFAPYDSRVHVLTTLSSAFIITTGLLRPLFTKRLDKIFDAMLFTVLVTIATPIAWFHHFGFLLAIFAALVGPAWASHVAWPRVVLCAAFMLAANLWSVLNLAAGTWANPLQSYVLLAALLTTGLLAWASSHVTPVPPGSHTRAGSARTAGA